MTFEPDAQLGLGLPGAEQRTMPKSLRERFVVPPFSILDRRAGYWQGRRRGWLSLGIKSEIGRDGNLLGYSDAVRRGGYGSTGNLADAGNARAKWNGEGQSDPGTSVFDPVLCELVYRWFCKPGGRILDPFAGGSVRGIVAALLGRSYLGIDLRQIQVEANREQAEAILHDENLELEEEPPEPSWIEGNATQLGELAAEHPADLIFTCPPYGDLEVYSDDPRDISTMSYARFRATMGFVIAEAIALLGEDRFAAIVVADIRQKGGGGAFRGFVADTIEQFEAAGARLYNQAVIVDPTGSASIRATKIFDSARKVVTCHQHLLVFCKGDPKKAAAPIIAAEAREEHDDEGSEAAPGPSGQASARGDSQRLPQEMALDEPGSDDAPGEQGGGAEPAQSGAAGAAAPGSASPGGDAEPEPGESAEPSRAEERASAPPWRELSLGEREALEFLRIRGGEGVRGEDFPVPARLEAAPLKMARGLWQAGFNIEKKIDPDGRERFVLHGERS